MTLRQALLDFDERTANGTAAVWLQSIWVFAAYGLLRTLALAPGRAVAWTALLAFTGFFTLNTSFTWPKLSAAAFACGAFSLWVLPEHAPLSRRNHVLGAVLAALALSGIIEPWHIVTLAMVLGTLVASFGQN